MDLEKPRFRHDLVARPLEDAGVFYVDVSDPDSGKQFRFYDVEYSIACAMDGDRNLASLVEWTRAELGVETSLTELKSVVTTLAGLGYLDGAAKVAGVEVVDLTTDVKPTAPPKAATPAHTPQPAPAPRFAPDTPAPGMSFGDDEMTRPATAEMAASAAALALDTAMDQLPIDDDNDFATDEPTRNAAAPSPDERSEDSVTMQRPIKPAAMAGGIADIVGAPPDAADPSDPLEMDLSAHVAVNKSKLAEAVKLSRAISVPTAAEVEAAATAPAEPARRESVATKLPDAPPAAATAPAVAAAAAVEAKRSPLVVVVILLLLAAAGGAAYYFLVYKQGQPVAPAAPKTSETTPATETAPRAPVSPKGRVASTEAPPATITAPVPAAIEWAVTDGQSVANEEVVAKLAGARRAEAPLTQAKDRLTFYQGELSRAAAANNTALIAQMQKKVDEKQQLVNDAQAKLEPLLVRASAAGPVQVLAPAGAKVAAGDPIARITPKDFVFTVTIEDAPVGLVVGAPVKLAPEGNPDMQLAGVVDKVAGAKAVVKLVPPVSVKAGDELVLLAP